MQTTPALACLLLLIAPPTVAQTVLRSTCIEPSALGGSFWLTLPGEDPHWRPISGAVFEERSDGTATMSGGIVNLSDPCKRFSFDVQLSGRLDPGDPGYPPSGSPHLTPFTTANLDSRGGTIDPGTWHYYTSANMTLNGKLCYDGASVTLSNVGPALQVGVGANGVDLSDGASAWFQVQSLTQPTTGTMIPTPFVLADLGTSFGASCPCFGGTTAAWNNYGNGVPGCNDVPAWTMLDLPLTGSSPRFSVGNPGSTMAQCALLWGFMSAQVSVPFLGGDLLVAEPYLSVDALSVSPGGLVFNCTIGEQPCQVGMEFFTQIICLDSCAPQGFALSQGMRIQIGDV